MVQPTAPAEIYQLHILLLQITPPIWRRLHMRSDSSIATLHELLQIAFDWSDFHLHRFVIRGKEYGLTRIGCTTLRTDARKALLSQFHFRVNEYAASHRAVAKLKTSGILPRRVQVRSCKYLNNVIEQDHRRIKQRVRPMLGFKRFETAAVTIRGIELAEKFKKHQFNLRPLTGKATTAPEMWARVLA